MENKNKVELSNKTIAKLAIAIATAITLKQSGEVIGPLTRKVLETLDDLDLNVRHFAEYEPKTSD